MATRYEVEKFLSEFKSKAKIFGIVYRDDRKKNVDTLQLLDIMPSRRTEIINSLTADDYSEGPLEDTLNRATDLWVFGKEIKQFEVYIKITIGFPNNSTICVSFHISEHPINYKFKEQ